jgi:hypothetical protein
MLNSNLLKEFLRVTEKLNSKDDFDALPKQQQEYVKSIVSQMEQSILETENELGITYTENELE